MTQPLRIEAIEGVTTLTLDCGERRNALTRELKEALRDAVADVARDPSARAVILAANGPAFCVGQDLGEHHAALAHGAPAAFATVREHYAPLIRDLMTMPKPVIAAVHGTCVGAGLGIALACDYAVYAAGARLATAFTGIGLTFDSGLSLTLPRAVGTARARRLVLFGTAFTAEEAIAWGAAGETVPPEAVAARAREVARALAAGPTTAYAETKRLLLTSIGVPVDAALDAALDAEADAQMRCGATDDHAAAVRAFIDRGTPSFGGR